jgi:hypothetical protein
VSAFQIHQGHVCRNGPDASDSFTPGERVEPEKADTEAKEREISVQAGVAGWPGIAQISNLFTPTARTETIVKQRWYPQPNTRGTSHAPRSIPILEPALAASATTVNVEFSGTPNVLIR